MSSNLIIVTGLIYLWIAIEQMTKGNIGMCITYFGYSFANLGLYMLEKRVVV
jgi:hypothetical protein